MAAPKDYYQTLGIERTATADEIKKAFRKLAAEHHPDKNPGDAAAEGRFKEVNSAYQVLGDPDKKSKYDAFGTADGIPRNSNVDPFVNLNDMMADFFGRGVRINPNAPTRGEDIKVTIELPLVDTYTGCKRELEYMVVGACNQCDGLGHDPSAGSDMCNYCAGTGKANFQEGMFIVSSACRHCAGRGRNFRKKCDGCRGAGREQIKRAATVTIPAGIAHGASLRLAGMGAPGKRRGPAGDAYVVVDRVIPDKRYAREGDNLIMKTTLSYAQACLGTSTTVLLPDNIPATVTFPPGVKHGHEGIVLEKGFTNPNRGGRKGALKVRIEIEVPGNITDEERELLLKLEASFRARG